MSDTLNLRETKDTGFSAIPPGRYIVSVEEVEETTTKAGDTMYNTTFEVAGGEYEGRKVWERFVWNTNAAWKIKNFLSAIGSELVDDPEFSKEKFLGILRGGAKASAMISVKKFDGKDTNEIGNYASLEVAKELAEEDDNIL